ncbi:TolC family protein [Paraglaciecola sp. 2405UD69-4]|uniref:TolC family protein n=1 Tax=Paraglaciecola sp. 2405UD69-4 TaxID=3391836 RepID=UPI0039C95347
MVNTQYLVKKTLLGAALASIGLLINSSAWAQTSEYKKAQLANAETGPTVDTLLYSMQHLHPYTKAIKEGAVQANADLDIANSAFDPYLEHDSFSRVTGYYDGTSLQQRIVKPLEDYNASVFTEYRVTDGNFPVYEQQYETQSAGEASVGIAFSLLKGREINKQRLGVTNARLDLMLWEVQANTMLNDFIYKGLVNYLTWYESSLQVEAVESLLATTSLREEAIATRVERGDLAQISLTEFRANLLEQRLLVEKLKQTRDGYAHALSYYLRDSDGHVINMPPATKVPEDIAWPLWVGDTQLSALRKQIAEHPALKSMRVAQEQTQNKVKLANNALLPKLDLKASIAKDIGSGSQTLDQVESKIGLSFSYPLGNRKAKAEVAKAKSKDRELSLKISAMEESLVQSFEQAYTYWVQAKNVTKLQQENAELAKTLSGMERQRFSAGDSNMFLLNARTSTEIKAEMKHIEAKVDLLKAELSLYKIVALLPTLNVK